MDKKALSGIALQQHRKYWMTTNHATDDSKYPTSEKDLNAPAMGYWNQIGMRMKVDRDLLRFFEWVFEDNQKIFESNLFGNNTEVDS